jgi:hypothetical protein
MPMPEKRWTMEQAETHLKKNVEGYGSAVVVAALFKKLYGKFPAIGLSGAQAEAADSIVPLLPKRQVNDPDEC